MNKEPDKQQTKASLSAAKAHSSHLLTEIIILTHYNPLQTYSSFLSFFLSPCTRADQTRRHATGDEINIFCLLPWSLSLFLKTPSFSGFAPINITHPFLLQ